MKRFTILLAAAFLAAASFSCKAIPKRRAIGPQASIALPSGVSLTSIPMYWGDLIVSIGGWHFVVVNAVTGEVDVSPVRCKISGAEYQPTGDCYACFDAWATPPVMRSATGDFYVPFGYGGCVWYRAECFISQGGSTVVNPDCLNAGMNPLAYFTYRYQNGSLEKIGEIDELAPVGGMMPASPSIGGYTYRIVSAGAYDVLVRSDVAGPTPPPVPTFDGTPQNTPPPFLTPTATAPATPAAPCVGCYIDRFGNHLKCEDNTPCFPMTPVVPTPTAGCRPDAYKLCLTGGRFEVSVRWETSNGVVGQGQAVPLRADSGSFWFFGSENLELLVKVLDARTVNGQFWVFSGGVSNVMYDITVKDVVTGQARTYHNPQGVFASFGDTAAFPGTQATRRKAKK